MLTLCLFFFFSLFSGSDYVDSNFSKFTLAETDAPAALTEPRPSLPGQALPTSPAEDPAVSSAFTDHATVGRGSEAEQDRAELDELLRLAERDQPVDEMRLSYLLDKVSLTETSPAVAASGQAPSSATGGDPGEDPDYALAVQLQREEEERARSANAPTGRRSAGPAPVGASQPSASQTGNSGCVVS